jgi:CRP-like cAMP-binding protein
VARSTGKQELVEALGSVPIFSELSKKELKEIVDVGTVMDRPAEDDVVTEGGGGVGFHLILAGEAKVVRNGRRIATLGPGQFFGEISVIDDGPRTATVTTLEGYREFGVSAWDFRPILRANPSITFKLLVHLCGRLREAETVATLATC